MALTANDIKIAQPGDFIEFKEQKIAEVIESLGENQDYSCGLKLKILTTIENESDIAEGIEMEIWHRKVPRPGVGNLVKSIDGKIKNTITFNHPSVRLQRIPR